MLELRIIEGRARDSIRSETPSQGFATVLSRRKLLDLEANLVDEERGRSVRRLRGGGVTVSRVLVRHVSTAALRIPVRSTVAVSMPRRRPWPAC